MTQPQTLPHPLRHRRRVELSTGGEIRSIHLVGIGGAGQRALAEFATGMGWQVSGSDANLTPEVRRSMLARGWQVCNGHHENAIPADCDVLVYSAAVADTNVERQAARELKIPQMSYSRMLGHLMGPHTGVTIAGTHGKSTTTAMTAKILHDAGLEPSAIFGAELLWDEPPGRVNTSTQSALQNSSAVVSGWAGAGELFVAEACEYQRSFLDLQPKFAAITSIEPDHFDYYKDFTDTCAAFSEFAAGVDAAGVLLVPHQCEHSRRVAESATAEVVTFALEPGGDWWATDIKRCGSGVRFRVFYRGWFFTEITLPVPGRHNVENALIATAIAHYAGADSRNIRESLAEFRGLKRRFERVGSWRGMTLIDDYAHHPTAVTATLETARTCYPKRRIVAVFQPHQVSRTVALMDEFAAALSAADAVIIAPIFAARETVSATSLSAARELAGRIGEEADSASQVCSATSAASLDHIIATLDDKARPGDVLITMGAGDIDRVYQEFTGRLQRHHAAG